MKITAEDIDKWTAITKELLSDFDLQRESQLQNDAFIVSVMLNKNAREDILKLHEFLQSRAVQQPNYIGRALHSHVTVHLHNDGIVEGVIDGYNNYEVRIKAVSTTIAGRLSEGEKDILILKSAIACIEGDFSWQGKAKKEEVQ